MIDNTIPFNIPTIRGSELKCIESVFESKKLSGNGSFTKLCHSFFEKLYGFKKVLLTTSCTDALEMSAILINIQPGDEVIMPSYTFVSTANAFLLHGAKIIFADSDENNPNINAEIIEPLITAKTKAIVVVHYAGVACNMEKIMQLANKYNIKIVEDAAQAIDSYYNGEPLGSIGHLATFSFHDTKNITCGEGGILVINDPALIERAEIVWEKGTNRSAFFRGEVDKYSWVDVGSSFLPSEITAAFLFGQLQEMNHIQQKRKEIWGYYDEKLRQLNADHFFQLPIIPGYASNNGHMYYLICKNIEHRTAFISFLKLKKIQSVYHYLSLHKSPFYQSKHDGRDLPNADRFTNCLVRLPFFYDITEEQQDIVLEAIKEFTEIEQELYA